MSERLAICRLAPDSEVAAWAHRGEFSSITRTAAELSIVCAEKAVPAGTVSERGWRALEVKGPLDFSLTGVLASLARPLAEAGISIFAVSTFDTDYVLVKEENVGSAVAVLAAAGHKVKNFVDRTCPDMQI